mmetsp:Transcript_18182/g.28204  ORF Transcript_18182/g.28204 Transcript_18182/m.28204 type:complete len:225 (-) Transcript_18182:368-1042(-)
MTRGWLLAVVLVILLPCALAKGKGGKGARGSSNGEEEIIIPLGGEMDFGGPQGGGFSIPLSPQMIAPQMGNMGGNGGSMGFEETEEIGPDGKPHIISEHSFGGPMKGAVNKGKPLTAAQKKQQKMMKKQMEGMAKDMAHMFDDGSFFGGRPQAGKDRKYQRDLFKNAIKAFDDADMNQMNGRPMINNGNSWGQARLQQKRSQDWHEKMSGKGDIINQAGIVIAR